MLIFLIGVFLVVCKDDYHTANSLKAARILSVIATTVLYSKVWTKLDGPIIFQGYMLFTLLAGATIDWMTEIQYTYKAITWITWPLYFISGTIPFSDLILRLFFDLEIANDSYLTSNFSQYIPKLFVFFATQIAIFYLTQKRFAYLEWIHKIPDSYLMFFTLKVTDIFEQYREQQDYMPVEALYSKKVLIDNVQIHAREPVINEIVHEPMNQLKQRIQGDNNIKPTQYLHRIYTEMMGKGTRDTQLVELKFNGIFRDILQCKQDKTILDFKEAMFFSLQQFMQGAEFDTIDRYTVIAIAQGYLNHQINIVDQEEFLAMNTIIRAKIKILKGLKDHRACSPVVADRLYKISDAKKTHQITMKLDSLRSSENIVQDVRETINLVTEVNQQPGIDLRFTDTLGQTQYQMDYRQQVVKKTYVRPQMFQQHYKDEAYQGVNLPKHKEKRLNEDKRQLSKEQMERKFSSVRGQEESARCLRNMSYEEAIQERIIEERQQFYQRGWNERDPKQQSNEMIENKYSNYINRERTIPNSYRADQRYKYREQQRQHKKYGE